MSKKITRNKVQSGNNPNPDAGVAGAVEEITASATKTVSGNWKPIAMLFGLVLAISLAVGVINARQAAKADQLQQALYEIKEDKPGNDKVDSWIGRLEALKKDSEGQTAEKSTYLEIVDLLIKQANPSASSTSFLTAPPSGAQPGPTTEANRKKMLEKARAIALAASSKPWADEKVKAWNEQVQKLVEGELNKSWLPESRSKEAPPSEEKAPAKPEPESSK